MSDWFSVTLSDFPAIVITAVGVYAAVIVLTQMVGLRSFSKMSGFDFAMTVAIGSMLASAIVTPSPSLANAVVALTTLYALQTLIAVGRRRTSWVSRLVDNEPLLIMNADGILRDNMRKAHMTEADLWAKLREANVMDPSQVRAVVMETTGDVSVLHGSADGPALHPKLLTSVRDADRAGLSA